MRILINDHAGHPFQIQLSRKLASRGHIVLHTYCSSVMTPHGAIARNNQDSDTFNIHAVKLAQTFNRYGFVSRLRQEKELGRKLSDIAISFIPDVIISANTPLKAQLELIKTSNTLNVRFVYWVQDLLGIGIRENLTKKFSVIGKLIGRYFQLLEQQLFKKSDYIVLISDGFKSSMPDELLLQNKLSIIENWAPLDELSVEPKENEWSKKYKIDKRFCFMYSGTLGMKHNPDLLLKLSVKLKHNKDCCLVVVSEGLGAQYLAAKKIEFGLNNLILLGFQPYEQFSMVMGSADVLLTILEPDAGVFAVPSKVLTYMCAQRPQLLAVPGENLAARIINDNNAGIVISPDDEEGFFSAATKLLNDKDLRDQYALNGLEYAYNTFDISTITDKFESIILK